MGFVAVVPASSHESSRQQMMAIVPLLMLGLLAATCLVASAEWRGGTTMLLGSGEEASAAHAIVTAASIDPDAVTARNPAVDASIMKEVEKAEKEQADEMTTEKGFAVGNEVVRDDGTAKAIKKVAAAKKALRTESLVRAVGWSKKH